MIENSFSPDSSSMELTSPEPLRRASSFFSTSFESRLSSTRKDRPSETGMARQAVKAIMEKLKRTLRILCFKAAEVHKETIHRNVHRGTIIFSAIQNDRESSIFSTVMAPMAQRQAMDS